MKKTLIMMLLISILLLSLTTDKDKNTIIIYSSMEQFRNDELQARLDLEFKGKNVRVMYLPTGKSASKIYLEKDKTDADIVLGLETSYIEKISDQLDSVTHLSQIQYLDDLLKQNSNDKYVIWEKQAGTILINKDILTKLGLDIPRSYEDLLDPQYRNLIAMPDPKSSGTGYYFYKSIVNSIGVEKALEYFELLSKNIKQFTESGSGPIKLMNQGEVAISLAMTFQSVNEINQGHNYEIVFPEEGSPYSLTGASIIKGKSNNKDIVEIFEYIVNDFFIYDKENFSPEAVYKGQVNKIENYPENINYADMTGIESISEKERLLALWKY